MLLNNITHQNILQAINSIDSEGIPGGAESNYYDVVYNQKRYPLKYLISLANEFESLN